MDDAAGASVTETHVSWVFFIGDGAYKLKKPVRTGFLDFSSVEQRRVACENEVRLNRRLAPDVYRGVLTVAGPDGNVCDHLVAMRRLPSAQRLSALVERGAPGLEGAIDEIAAVLAAFHQRAERSTEIDRAAGAAVIAGNWEVNTDELGPFAETVVDPESVGEVRAMAARYAHGRARLFDARIAAHRIVDGHGDLLAGDVFVLDDGPRLLDCLEFDDHYTAYRAQVRAKVACLRAGQGATSAAGEARDLLELARRHLRLGEVALVLIGGPPGTGKTTLGRGLAEASGAELLRSDLVRKELAGLDPGAPAPAGYRHGIYEPGATEAVYAELLRRARDLLELGRTVVIDASWDAAARRAAGRAVAASAGARMVELRCRVPSGLAGARIARRNAEGSDASDATPEVAAAMAAVFDPWPEAGILDTAGDEAAVLAEAEARTGLSAETAWRGPGRPRVTT